MSNFIDKIKEELESVLSITDSYDVKGKIESAMNHADEAMDKWLVRLAMSKWSMQICIGFGVSLLLIGYGFGKVV